MKFTFKFSQHLIQSLCVLLILFSFGVAAQQTEQSFTTVYRYDINGRVTGVITPDPDGAGPLNYSATRNTYGVGGLLTLVESGELSVWLNETYQPADWSSYFTVVLSKGYEYDNYGRKTKEWLKGANDVIESLTQLSYNDKGLVQCKAVRMNKGAYVSLPASACDQSVLGSEGPDRITRYTYNDLDQVLTQERAVGTSLVQTYVSNTYDGYLLKTQTDANGNKTELAYDDFGRLTHRYYPSKTAVGTVSTTDYNQYGYDANNNITMERKRNTAVINFTYDNNNRMIVKDYVNNAQTADVYYNYDLRGITLHSRFGNDTGEGIINKPDGFGNIVQTDTTLGGITRTLRYAYDLNNNRTRVTHPDNVWFQYDFDNRNRVKRLSESVIPMLDITYTPAGRRGVILRNYNAADGTVATRTNYQFNNAQRLLNLIQDFPGTGSDLTNTFTYNPASQVTQLTQSNTMYQYTGNENRTGAYTINGLNQYTAVNGAATGYDNNGNLTSDNGAIYQYDDENRLRSTSGTGIPASTLRYDPLGRLYETTIAGVVTRFLYDGDALVAEYESTGTLTRRYVHGDQVDEPWVEYTSAAIGSANWRYLHADHQGSIIAHSSNTGLLQAILSYDAYGIPKSSNTGRFGYTGQAALKALGLFHYKARMYSPKLGRFLQTDPIYYADNMNMYAYVGNDPVNKIDPEGKFAWFAALLFIGAGATASAPANAPAPGDIPQQMSAVDAVAAVIPIVRLERAAFKTGETVLSNSDNVVRGGTNSADRFTNGSGVTTNADGTLNGVSVNSASGASVDELAQGIRNGQIGTTTVGEVRAAGGDVIPFPTANNSNHCILCGITAKKAEELFTPTIKNPNK